MPNTKTSRTTTLQLVVLRVSRIHFWFVLAYVLHIVVADSWNLIPPDAALNRWSAAGSMLAATTAAWYLARSPDKPPLYYRSLAGILILVDVVAAAYTVFAQRGMASQAIVLFAVPIVIAALLRSQTALRATAIVSAGAYALAAVRYFILHPGEGYKVELYGGVAFYCLIFFVLAALLGAVYREDKA